MIRLTKVQEPAILQEKSEKWTAELLEVIHEIAEIEAVEESNEDTVAKLRQLKSKRKSKLSRYSHAEIKEAVIAETGGKCAYCEGDVRVVSHGDIEHVFPKSIDYSMAFQWKNLTFACQLCNQEKSSKNPLHDGIIDPYECEPKDYIQFFGSFARTAGPAEGVSSITNLGLNRDALVESRNEVIGSLSKEIVAIQNARSEAERKALAAQFEEDHINKPSVTFSAMRRDFWALYKDGL